ncbi:MAG: hypothetical protein C4297_00470 [Gemmataceae bacterium]
MYSIVLMVALSANAAPAAHEGGAACHGAAKESAACHGAVKRGHCHGGLFAKRERHGCHGGLFAKRDRYACHGGLFSRLRRGHCHGVVVEYNKEEKKPEKKEEKKPEKVPVPPKEKAEKPKAEAPAPAEIIVSLPEDAKLTIDGMPTVSRGSARIFASPELQPGKDYVYVLTAEVVRGGEIRSLTRQALVRAGQKTHVSFDFSSETGSR